MVVGQVVVGESGVVHVWRFAEGDVLAEDVEVLGVWAAVVRVVRLLWCESSIGRGCWVVWLGGCFGEGVCCCWWGGHFEESDVVSCGWAGFFDII